MLFDTLTGNDRTVAAMKNMVATGRVPHAILLYENDGGGAFPLCLAFLEALYGGSGKVAKMIHPDIHFVFPVTGGSKVSTSEKPTSDSYMQWFRELALEQPCFTESALYQALGIEGKSGLIAVGEARLILDKLSLTGVEGGWRTVVMYLPEKMNQEAANRLLKAIEEPEENTEFILITHAPEKVLQTIASRCQRIQLGAEVRAPQFDEPELLDAVMDALVDRDLYAALQAGEQLSALPSRESAKAFCVYAADAMRNIFLEQQGLKLPQTGSGKAREWASRVRRSFAREALACFDGARRLVDRNVNMKIIFTDLVDRLYGLI